MANAQITQLLSEVKNQIRATSEKFNRDVSPALMAVSKTQAFDQMNELYEVGQRIFGENYVQELIDKKKQFESLSRSDADLQMIGHLQTNKVKQLLPYVQTIHSVDSIRLLEEIEKRAAEIQKKIHCYFQINIDHEESKGGFESNELSELEMKVKQCRFIIAEGLMCVPNPDLDVKFAFQKMRTLSATHEKTLGSGLSMGMSSDYESAIECGSTMIRIGSKLFGERKKVAPK